MKSLVKLFDGLNLLISISLIVTLIWWHGFEFHAQDLYFHIFYLNFCFAFFVFQFIFRANKASSIWSYLKRNKLELFLFCIFFIDQAIGYFISDTSILKAVARFSGIESQNNLYLLLIHFTLLLIVGIELGKAIVRSTIWSLPPGILFILSFVILISVGSSLLMLPEVTTSKGSMPFVDALFTSVSANCVTGLIVVDTATFFTIKGKIILLILIQLGGLNIVAFATFFFSIYRNSKIKKDQLIPVFEIFKVNKKDQIIKMVQSIILISIVIELVGGLLMYIQWNDNFDTVSQGVFNSLFHSVSSFNNAGFTLFENGFANTDIQPLYSIHLLSAFLIILGGLGFSTIREIFSINQLKNIIRLEKFKLTLQSKIAVYLSAILIVIGAVLFFIFEKSNSLDSQEGFQSLITSFFQSVTTRTAGFNTVDIGLLLPSTLILMIVLMFIGASTGSTGGGIKTSTLYVIMTSFLKKITRRTKIQDSNFSQTLLKKAVYIILFSGLTILICSTILYSVEDNKSYLSILFEVTSAYSTVGLSTGITSDLSTVGKIIISTCMFIGRLGPLAITFSLINLSRIPSDSNDDNLLLG